MEKKKTSSLKAVPDNSRQLSTQYIRQPYPISAIQADLSTQQIRILIGMMQSIQDSVRKMFDRGPKDGELLLFPDMKDDRLSIDFKFSDVAERPDYYRDVERVAKKFMEMVFRYEDKQKGEITLAHFVDEITYPKRGSKRDRIRFTFTKKQARTVFNFTIYSRYLMTVATTAKSKHTARLYMLITSARGFEQENEGTYHWYVGYEELRRILGCDVKDDSGRWCRKRQKDYKHFKSDILRTAEHELKALADEGKSDCWFEFSEQPENFIGEPKTLDFLVRCVDKGVDDSSEEKTKSLEW